jgi:purine-nucleoside phosphorylase
MQALGATTLVVTNVAGGVNHHFEPGDVMLIEDHLNFQFRSPLRGRGPLVDRDRFVDLAEPYSRRLLELARKTMLEIGIPRIEAGTYFGVLGPSYETPAEIRMIKKLGGDAVGMSTVPEVITARHLGMEVLGICCISNLAAGQSGTPLSHDDVIRGAAAMEEKLKSILTALLPRINDAK